MVRWKEKSASRISKKWNKSIEQLEGLRGKFEILQVFAGWEGVDSVISPGLTVCENVPDVCLSFLLFNLFLKFVCLMNDYFHHPPFRISQ